MIKARNSGIVLAKKKAKECMIIDITVPEKARVKNNADEKIDKYSGEW